MHRVFSPASFSILALSGVSIVLSGCSVSKTIAPSAVSEAGLHLRGGVHGGSQPIVGAQVYLMAAGTSGYGSAAVPLLTNGYVLSDSAGGFSITGDYTCPSAQTQVYLAAVGGNPGLPGNAQNPDLALLAGLGACGNLNANTFIAVNEVTTVATAYALSGFMTGTMQLSSSGTPLALQGLANAFVTINKLVDISTGTVRTTPVFGFSPVVLPATNPISTINSLANTISSCVNSGGSTATGTGTNLCSALENAALSASGTPATDTVEAILNIAHLPGQKVATLYSLASATAPFQPSLASAPADWSLSVTYGGLGTQTITGGVAIDPMGDLWAVSSTVPEVELILASGGVGAGPLPANEQPTSIAIDPNFLGWVGTTGGDIVRINPFAGPQGTSTIPTGMPNVNSVTIATDNTIWSSGGYPNQLVHFDASGAVTGTAPAPNYSTPFGLAVDATNNLWIANSGYSNVSRLAAGAVYASNFSVGYLEPRAVAIGQSGHVWVADSNSNPGAVSELASDGTPIPGSPYSGGALYAPWSVAMDGDNHAWFTLNNCRCVVAMGSGGSFVTPNTGIASNAVKYGIGIAVDGSGNVWVENNDTSITEIVGAAAPVVTPLAYAASTNTLGQRP